MEGKREGQTEEEEELECGPSQLHKALGIKDWPFRGISSWGKESDLVF